MNKKFLINKAYDASKDLHLDNFLYLDWVKQFTFSELEKDLNFKGDISSDFLFNNDDRIDVFVKAKSEGLICGIYEISYFLKSFDDLRFEFLVRDGDLVENNDRVLILSSNTKTVFALERTVLNFLSHMSGIASFTNSLLKKINTYPVSIAATRKTSWGLLDKKAVFIGGGLTHRLNLSDAIMLKDTHLAACGKNWDFIFEKILTLENLNVRFFEIEVENKKDALELFSFFTKNKLIKFVPIIMLDNMSPEEISETLFLFKILDGGEKVLVEASGGINEKNILDYAKTGVDVLSMGCLTNGVKSMDFSLKVEKY